MNKNILEELRANLTPEKEDAKPVDNEQLRGDESGPILQVMNAALKLTTAGAELQNEIEKHKAERYQKVSLGKTTHEPSIITKCELKRRSKKEAQRINKKVAFFRYSYYDIVFKYLVEHILNAEWVDLPSRTKRTIDLGSRYSSDYVCTPFKHLLGDYIEALEAGADIIVTFAGPCRLGYYGEVHASILHDLGYEFETLNFSELSGVKEYLHAMKKINPHVAVHESVRNMLTLVKMAEYLDEAWDFYLANAGFEAEAGSFDALMANYHAEMKNVVTDNDLVAVQKSYMEKFRELPINKPLQPIRIGIVGELFTAIDQHSNLNMEKKFLNMGVELHRYLNLTHRYINYNETNLRAGISDYVRYDMGPTSTITIAAAKRYAEEGFDGIVHLKSSGCTPEIDCVPVLQELAHNNHIPTLYLTFDSQTSDAGLDTRLEAFYDMLAMKRGKNIS